LHLQLVLNGRELWDEFGGLVAFRDSGIMLWKLEEKLPQSTTRGRDGSTEQKEGKSGTYGVPLEAEVTHPSLASVVHLATTHKDHNDDTAPELLYQNYALHSTLVQVYMCLCTRQPMPRCKMGFLGDLEITGLIHEFE